MKRNVVDPPAAVRPASRSLKQCASAANAALEKGEKAFVEAGQALIEALEQVAYGQKRAWLKENFKGSHMTAYRLMRAASCNTVLQLGAVADGISEPVTIPEDSVPQEDTPTRGTDNPPPQNWAPTVPGGIYCRPCRVSGRAKNNCKDCAELRKQMPSNHESNGAATIQTAAPPATKPYVPLDAGDGFEPCDDCVPEVTPDPYAGLPKSVQNALADTWHLEVARDCAKRRKETMSAVNWSEWLDAGRATELWKELEETYVSATPRRPCPECGGTKKIGKDPCGRCRGCGYLASQGD